MSHQHIKSLLFVIERALRFVTFGLKITNMDNFQPFEVVGRGSETQVQVGENFKIFILAL